MNTVHMNKRVMAPMPWCSTCEDYSSKMQTCPDCRGDVCVGCRSRCKGCKAYVCTLCAMTCVKCDEDFCPCECPTEMMLIMHCTDKRDTWYTYKEEVCLDCQVDSDVEYSRSTLVPLDSSHHFNVGVRRVDGGPLQPVVYRRRNVINDAD